MREIKFRAKVKGYTQPLDVVTIDFGNCVVCIVDPERGDQDTFDWSVIEAFLQFTGLHDQNGKEIYEGDLVKVDSYYIGDSFIKEHRAEIKYGNGGFYIDYDFAPELCEEEIYNEQIEVIGNIYESP